MLFVAALLLALAVLFTVLAVERWRLPSFLALMLAALAYGLLDDRRLQSFGNAFTLGFAHAIEQIGLLVVAGAMLAGSARLGTLPKPLTALGGLAAGLTLSPAGALALLQPAAARSPRRTLLMLYVLLAAEALLVTSPVAVAAAWVVHADFARQAMLGLPLAALAALAAWQVFARSLPGDGNATASYRLWIIPAFLVTLMLVHALAQVPSEPLGKGASALLYTNLGRPFVIATAALLAVCWIARRSATTDLAEREWAPLLLTVAASGGLSFVLNETGAPELLAEMALQPSLGLLVPFLAAAIVKTMQGSSLTAVLTAVGMTEPMLASLGLDSPWGRVVASASAGAGSIALCHINDPLFWIAAHLARMPPRQALVAVTGGSAVVAVTILAGLCVLAAVLL